MTRCRSKTKTAKRFCADGGGGGTRRIRNSSVKGEEGRKGRSMTNRKRSMYNLKPHSAFKLLTMAAGYKVFCPVAGFVDAKSSGWWWGTPRGGWGRARFKSLIYLRGDCGRQEGRTGRIRPDTATSQREKERDTWDGERWGEGERGRIKKIKGLKSLYFAAGIQPSYMCDTFQNSAPPFLPPSSLSGLPPSTSRRSRAKKKVLSPASVSWKVGSEPWPFSQKLARILGKEFHAGIATLGFFLCSFKRKTRPK